MKGMQENIPKSILCGCLEINNEEEKTSAFNFVMYLYIIKICQFFIHTFIRSEFLIKIKGAWMPCYYGSCWAKNIQDNSEISVMTVTLSKLDS